jgi:quercetin dioxygenase-like cupin family protein
MKKLNWDDIPAEKINDKFLRKLAYDGSLMIAWMECPKGSFVPTHSHANEQLTFVVKGCWEFEIEGKKVHVSANDVLFIPPNAPHSATALEDLVAYDIFTPPREDWIKGTDGYLRNVQYGKK